MTRQSGPGMRSDGKLSPRESQYSGDGSLWRRRGAGTGASVVTLSLSMIAMTHVEQFSRFTACFSSLSCQYMWMFGPLRQIIVFFLLFIVRDAPKRKL